MIAMTAMGADPSLAGADEGGRCEIQIQKKRLTAFHSLRKKWRAASGIAAAIGSKSVM
jgi:hypothetical protein